MERLYHKYSDSIETCIFFEKCLAIWGALCYSDRFTSLASIVIVLFLEEARDLFTVPSDFLKFKTSDVFILTLNYL